MARMFASNGNSWSKAVILSICFSLLLGSVNSQAYDFTTLAKQFCDSVAGGAGSSCDCTDTVINKGASSWCSFNKPLGPGIAIFGTPTFTGWQDEPNANSNNILSSETCDARSDANNLACGTSTTQSVTASTTTTYTVGVGLEVDLEFDLPLAKTTAKVSFSIEAAKSTTLGNTIQAMTSCGPGTGGQPAGTCQVYTQTYTSYDLPNGRTFTYDVVANGGAMMSFGDSIDLSAVPGTPSDSGSHFIWYFTIDQMVAYGQSPAANGDVANVGQFDPPSLGNPVTFHGSATISGQFLVGQAVCKTMACDQSSSTLAANAVSDAPLKHNVSSVRITSEMSLFEAINKTVQSTNKTDQAVNQTDRFS